jgi:AraC family transcriptional regulator
MTPGTTPSEAEELILAHLAAVRYIEQNLFEPMTVKSIAQHAGLSPSRFSGSFTRMQGESVMAYVRGRRLESAMRTLFSKPETRLLDLAFECGFDSQEAFTRAFARAFGHPPGRLRAIGTIQTLVRRRRTSMRGPEIHERVERIPDLHLAGIARRLAPANFNELPAQWRQLDAARDFPGQIDAATYAVRTQAFVEDGSLEMLAALRVTSDCEPPPPLQKSTIPGCTCVVFRHVLGKGDVFPQLKIADDAILASHLPASGHRLSDAPPFDVFPQGLAVTPGSWIDHYFPIRD